MNPIDIKAQYENDFKKVQQHFKSNNSNLLLQNKAYDLFKIYGLPAKSNEAWRYTPLSALPATLDPFIEETELNEEIKQIVLNTSISASSQLVFIDGKINLALTQLPDGITLDPVDDSILEEYSDLFKRNIGLSFTGSLAMGLTQKFYHLDITQNAQVTTALSIVDIATEKSKHKTVPSRILVTGSKDSQAKISHFFCSQSNDLQYFRLPYITIHLEENAQIDYLKIQNESLTATHWGVLEVSVKENASFSSFVFQSGAKVSRQEIFADINGVNANINIDGLYILNGEQISDNYSIISHNQKHTYAGQLYKGILSEKARSAFTGKIVIQRDCLGSNSSQLNKNLLLSRHAKVNTSPQLEVYADDVKCNHGATVGQMDPEQIFYLQTRGMNLDAAKVLLCQGFAYDLIEKIKDKKLSTVLHKAINDKLVKII